MEKREKEMEDLVKLMELEYHVRVSAAALNSLKRKHMLQQELLPVQQTTQDPSLPRDSNQRFGETV